MEYFFEITAESPHYQEQIDYSKNCVQQNKDVKRFKAEHDISGTKYMLYDGYLWVERTPHNVEKFTEQFRNVPPIHNCLPFKRNSSIGKAFKNANITYAIKPFVPEFFKSGYGSWRTVLFDYNNKVYLKVEIDDETLETPKGFVKMKGSEFYGIIEEAEAEENA